MPVRHLINQVTKRMEKESAPIDGLLIPWLRADVANEGEQLLSQLITTHINPIIEGIARIKLRLRSAAGQAEADDLQQEALMELLVELRKCRSQPEQPAIGDVRGLAAIIAYRACYRWRRRQSPPRRALKNRLQYLLTRHADLALWPDAQGRLVGGLAAWRGRNDRASSAQLRALTADEEGLALPGSSPAARLGAALLAVFNRLNCHKFSLLAPIGKVVLRDRPTFKWTRLSGATAYVVEVYDAQFNLVAKSPELTRNVGTPQQPLARGQNYASQVRVLKDGQEIQAPRPPAPQAKFRVLDQAQAQALAEARPA